MANPMGSEHATAMARICEIDSQLHSLEGTLSEATEALEVLRARQAQKNDPAAQEAAEKAREQIRVQREIIDKNLALFAKRFRSAMKPLAEIADAETAIREIHPQFDKLNYGRASVLSWLENELSPFSGNGGYIYKAGAPTEPGTMYPPVEAILRYMEEDED